MRSPSLTAAVATCLGLCFSGASVFAAGESTNSQLDLIVQDPRPVAKAAAELTNRYGYLISYEDPRYTYTDDLLDVTAEVSSSGSGQRADGMARRVLVPAGGTLELRAVATPELRDAGSTVALIESLLDVQASRSNGGRFRVQHTGNRFHIVPTNVRDSNGEWTANSSILDTPITFPVAKRDGMATLKTILSAVGKLSGYSVVVGTAPLNLLSKPVELGADNENATEVLIAALDATGSRLIWNLFFAPDLRIYVLNLKTVPDRNVSEPVIPAPPISADGSSPLGKSNRR